MRFAFIRTKIFSSLLILFGFFITLSIISATLDVDFGWHLRFGKDGLNNNFQYQDHYTYSYDNKNWVNHEWGGDMVFWWLDSHWGYFSLVILISAALWAAFLLALKIFHFDFTPAHITIALLMLLASRFILMMRLAMLAPLFFVLIWWTLEKMPEKKTYYWWPLIFWVWGSLHGSWILGFITINIYIVGNAIGAWKAWKAWQAGEARKTVSQHSKHPQPPELTKPLQIIKQAIIWQIISATAIALNPYGFNLWREIIHYFTFGYYKQYINEWLPSFFYPVYWWPLLIMGIAIVAVIAGWKQKKINWPRMLLFAFLLVSAVQYKRNNLFFLLACAPLMAGIWQEMTTVFLKIISKKRLALACGWLAIVAFCAVYAIKFAPRLRVDKVIWQDKQLLDYYGFPAAATNFLRAKISQQKNVRVFNAYGWGGYLVWNLPHAQIFLDGRSAATWQADDGQPMLKKYINAMTEANGLPVLEKDKVKFVLLENSNVHYPQPNWINKLLFRKDELNKILKNEPTKLENDLRASKKWKLVFSDSISNVWEKL